MTHQLMRAAALAGAPLRPKAAEPPRFWIVHLHHRTMLAQHHGSEAEAVRAGIEALRADPTADRFSLEGKP